MATKRVIREGARKKAPFTVCVVANPTLDEGAGSYTPDPILEDEATFDRVVAYVDGALFGRLPGQREPMLGAPDIEPHVRLVSVFDATASDCLVEYYADLLVPRRDAIAAFVARHGEAPDVAFAVSASTSHSRSASYFTTDDDGSDGVPFVLGARRLFHRKQVRVPGSVALHVSAYTLTALHEFQHALSSYSNGTVLDLYAQQSPGNAAASVNCRTGAQPFPDVFDTMDGRTYGTARTRLGAPYPPGWTTYHCERIDDRLPAIMDNYFVAPALGGTPEQCQNDAITRRFLLDRIHARLSR